MATIPELLDGHITLEVECLDRLYLNGYIGKLATGTGLSMFMRFQLGMPVPSPVVLGRVIITMAQNIHFENPPPPTENEVVPSRRNAIPAKTRATNAAGAARASRNRIASSTSCGT